jgi:hypothetical protein
MKSDVIKNAVIIDIETDPDTGEHIITFEADVEPTYVEKIISDFLEGKFKADKGDSKDES